MTNTYPTGPKKGQETGTFSLLINPSAGQNKLMPQIIEPFVFSESVKSASASPSLPHSPMPIMDKLEELLTFWGVVLNPIAPLTLPKPQEFAYQITNVPFAAATEASSSAADANAGNTSASDAAAGPA